MSGKKTAIVTGASGGIGAGLVEGFLKHGYNVLATSLNARQSLTASPTLLSSMAISVSRTPLWRLSKRRSRASGLSMFL